MRAYLLTPATFALGVAAGATGYATLPDAAAAALERFVTVGLEVPAANGAAATLRGQIEAVTCALIEAQHGIPDEDCSVEAGSVTSITWGDPVVVSHTARFAGTWTQGEPQ